MSIATVMSLVYEDALQCESKKMSHSSAEHGAVAHEEALGASWKGLTAGLEGWWWSKGIEIAGGPETYSCCV